MTLDGTTVFRKLRPYFTSANGINSNPSSILTNFQNSTPALNATYSLHFSAST